MKRKSWISICLVLLMAGCAAVFAACHKNTDPEKVPLAAPVIALVDNVVSWTAVPNATSYEVRVGDAAHEVSETSYTINETAPGDYVIYVTARSTNAAFAASARSNTVTFTVVAPEDATLESLSATTPPRKTTYYLDERATEPDLGGLVLSARYSDLSHKTVALADCTVGAVDLAAPGTPELTISYTDGEVTKSVQISLTVAVRGMAEIGELRDAVGDYAETGAAYEIAEGEVTSVVALDGTLIATASAAGKVTIGNEAFGTAYEKVMRVNYADGSVEFVRAVRAIGIDSPEDFALINQKLDGYYRLTKSIDFSNSAVLSVQIGAAPLINAPSEGYMIDPTGAGSAACREGEAFTGTFDGNGYAIMNYRLATDAYTQVTGYGLGLFGSIGATGTVRNVTLRNVHIHGGQDTGLIAGLNLGTVENIVIEGNCSLYSNYNRAGIVNTNGGKIVNAVSYVTEYQRNKTPYSALTAAYEGDGTAQNAYVTADRTEIPALAAIAGWRWLEGAGMIYANPGYVSWGGVAALELPLGGSAALNPVAETGTEPVYAFYPAEEQTFVPGAEFTVQEGRLVFADFANTTAAAGDKFLLLVRSADWGYSDLLTVTVTAAAVTEYTTAADLALSRPEGLELDAAYLAAIDVTAHYTDGTTRIVHPLRAQNYDPATLGAQTVRFWLTETDYLDLEVTTTAKQVASVAVTTLPATTSYTVGDALDLTGAQIKVVYDNGTETTLDVTAAMLDAQSYDMNTAGAYDVTVAYENHTDTFRIVVAAAALTGITLDGAPAKTAYLLGGTIEEADLTGLTITAGYADGETASGIAVTTQMLGYDFSTAGAATVTVTYAPGVTASYEVTVRNYATALAAAVAGDVVVYGAAQDPDWQATFQVTMADGTTAAVSGVTASAATPGRRTITFTYTDANGIDVTAEHAYDIWYEIASVSEWAMLNTYPDGYFRLAKSLDFESSSSNSVRIGTLPLFNRGDDGYVIDPTGVGEEAGQLGAAFTGRLDGQGYMLLNFKRDGYNAYGSKPAAYAATIFAYLGTDAQVRNLTVRGGLMWSWQNGAGLCGLNRGLIENVVIESGLKIASVHGDATTVGAIASNNQGTIRNAVSYVTTAAKGADQSRTIALQIAATNGGTVENAVVTADTAEIAALTAIAGWSYLPGAGTVYGNADYVKVTQTRLELPLGGELALNVAFADGDRINFAFYGAKSAMKTVWRDGAHHLAFDGDFSAAAVGDTFVVAVYTTGWKNFDKVTVTITAAPAV